MDPKKRIYIKCVVCRKTPRLLFSFPKNDQSLSGKKRYMQWLTYAVEYGADLDDLLNRKHKHLCSGHFTDNQFQTPKRLKLLRTAVPTVNFSSRYSDSIELVGLREKAPETGKTADTRGWSPFEAEEDPPDSAHNGKEHVLNSLLPQHEDADFTNRRDVMNSAEAVTCRAEKQESESVVGIEKDTTSADSLSRQIDIENCGLESLPASYFSSSAASWIALHTGPVKRRMRFNSSSARADNSTKIASSSPSPSKKSSAESPVTTASSNTKLTPTRLYNSEVNKGDAGTRMEHEQRRTDVDMLTVTPDYSVKRGNVKKDDVPDQNYTNRTEECLERLNITPGSILADATKNEKRKLPDLSSSPRALEDSVIECIDITDKQCFDIPGEASRETENGSVKPHVVQVLGSPNFQDPTVIKSVLEKVNLKKQGPVYVLPLKKSKEKSKPMTKTLVERVIQNLPAVDIRLKGKLLSLIRGLSGKPYRMKSISRHRQSDRQISDETLNEKTKKLNKCTCTLHCNKYIKRKPIIKVSPVAYTKLDAQSMRCDEKQPFCDDKAFHVENIFTVSTILTNVNDKSQIEQLCQMLIESLFKLKNVNINGVMSKLVVYLSQGSGDEASIGPDDSSFSGDSYLNNRQEVIKEKIDDIEPCRKHVRVNLNVFHDHSYLSQESQVLFDKPPYLVKLVNIDTYKGSNKKVKTIEIPPKKILNENAKLRRYITRLKDFLKKKNERIDKLNFKIKYLGSSLCQEKGLKRIRYPRKNVGSDENTQRNKGDILDNDREIVSGLKEKRHRKKTKSKILLSPDLVPPLFPSIPCREPHPVQISEMTFDDRFDEFYDSFVGECVDVCMT